jgi:hypothetical protein
MITSGRHMEFPVIDAIFGIGLIVGGVMLIGLSTERNK